MFDEKKLDFLIKFGSYKAKYVFLRIFFITCISFSITLFTITITPESELLDVRQEYMFLLVMVAFTSISEMNLLLMHLLNRSKFLKWKLYLQTLIVILGSIFLSLFWVYLIQIIIGSNEPIILHRPTLIVLLAGLLVIVIHLLINIVSNLLKEWIGNKHEIIALREAKLLNDYNTLKDQLNPHFLFNNLSVLKSLIRYSQDSAEIFTQNFTNVYRYVLTSHDKKLVPLQEELKFLESYIALHKERIGEGLIVNFNINKSCLNEAIPPMSLQLLVENAIKHNTANRLHSLTINISTEEKSLIVENNLNAKKSTYSTKTGLKSLVNQYKLLANKEVNIIKTEEYFKVVLPLL